MNNVNYFTIDFDVPELQKKLDTGGNGENGYDLIHLVGVEIIPPKVS